MYINVFCTKHFKFVLGDIRLCDLSSGSSTHQLSGHEGQVQCVQWNPRNQYNLVSGGRDHTIRLWDIRSGRSCLRILNMMGLSSPISESKSKKHAKKVPEAHKSRITSLCFTNDGLWLISFGFDGKLKVWNSTTGDCLNVKFGCVFTGIKTRVNLCISQMTYPDLVYVPSKSFVFVYEVFSGALVNILKGHFSDVHGVIFNPKNSQLYTYANDRNFITWIPRIFKSKKNDENDELNNSNFKVIPDSPVNLDAWSSSDED